MAKSCTIPVRAGPRICCRHSVPGLHGEAQTGGWKTCTGFLPRGGVWPYLCHPRACPEDPFLPESGGERWRPSRARWIACGSSDRAPPVAPWLLGTKPRLSSFNPQACAVTVSSRRCPSPRPSPRARGEGDGCGPKTRSCHEARHLPAAATMPAIIRKAMTKRETVSPLPVLHGERVRVRGSVTYDAWRYATSHDPLLFSACMEA